MITIEQAEKIRKKLGLDYEEFSYRIGYSSRAYYQAKKRGKFSRWMAKEIRQRFRVHVSPSVQAE